MQPRDRAAAPKGPKIPGPFTAVPKLPKGADFASMSPLEVKLLVYLAEKRRSESQTVAGTTIKALAAAIGASSRRTSGALHSLAGRELVKVSTDPAQQLLKRIELVYRDPRKERAQRQTPSKHPFRMPSVEENSVDLRHGSSRFTTSPLSILSTSPQPAAEDLVFAEA